MPSISRRMKSCIWHGRKIKWKVIYLVTFSVRVWICLSYCWSISQRRLFMVSFSASCSCSLQERIRYLSSNLSACFVLYIVLNYSSSMLCTRRTGLYLNWKIAASTVKSKQMWDAKLNKSVLNRKLACLKIPFQCFLSPFSEFENINWHITNR